MENGMMIGRIGGCAFNALFIAAIVMVSRRFFVTRLRFARDRSVFSVEFGRGMLRKFLFLGYARRFRQERLLWLYIFFLADVAAALSAFAVSSLSFFLPQSLTLANAGRISFALTAILTIAPPFLIRLRGGPARRRKRRRPS